MQITTQYFLIYVLYGYGNSKRFVMNTSYHSLNRNTGLLF